MNRLLREIREEIMGTRPWEWKMFALVWVPFALIFVMAWAFNAWATVGCGVSITPGETTSIKLSPGSSYSVRCSGVKPSGVEATLCLYNHGRAFTIPGSARILPASSTSFSQNYNVTMGVSESVLNAEQVQCQVLNKEMTYKHAVSQAPRFTQNPLPPTGWSVWTNTNMLNYDAAHPTKKLTITLNGPAGHGGNDVAALIVSGNSKGVIVPGTGWMSMGTGNQTVKTIYIPGSGLKNGDIVYVYIYADNGPYVTAVSNRMGVRKY